MSSFFKLKKYCSYRWHAKRGVNAHSPFMYHLSLHTFDEKKTKKTADNQKHKSKYERLILKITGYFGYKNPVFLLAETSSKNRYSTLFEGFPSTIFLSQSDEEKTVQTAISQADLIFADRHLPESDLYSYFEKTVKYVDQNGVFICDGIYRSPEMAVIWEKMKTDPEVTVSIDLYQMGLIFFRKESSKENFIIKY